jgi:hypothetical protein
LNLFDKIRKKLFRIRENLWNILPFFLHHVDYNISKFRYENNIYLPKSKNKGLRYFPREIEWIDPRSIRYYDPIRLFSGIYYIQNGNWDKEINGIKNKVQYRVIDELLNKSIPIQRLTDYEFTINKFMEQNGIDREKAIELANKKYQNILELIETIKQEGFKTQAELGNSSHNKFNTWYDEIRISITRYGDYILNGSGNHRLFIAQQLRIKRIPVVVIRKHYLYLINNV